MCIRYSVFIAIIIGQFALAALLQAQESYTPTRLEWLTTVANATYAQKTFETAGYSVHFGKGPTGSNAIVVAVSFDPERADKRDVEKAVEKAKRGLQSIVAEKGWEGWIKVVPRPPQSGAKPSEGDESYSPTCLDWLSLQANITWPEHAVEAPTIDGFVPGQTGTNTIMVLREAIAETENAVGAKDQLSLAEEHVRQIATTHGWQDWVKISPDAITAKDVLNEGDQPYKLRPAEWVAALANLSLAVDAWDRDGFRTHFSAMGTDKQSIVATLARNPKFENDATILKEAALVRRVLGRMIEAKQWDWIKITTKIEPPFEDGERPKSAGDELVEFSRLQYLAMTANMTLAVRAWESEGYSIIYSAGPPSSDTIFIIVMYNHARVDRAALTAAIEVGRRSLLTIAELNGWDSWLRVEVIDKTPKLPESNDAP